MGTYGSLDLNAHILNDGIFNSFTQLIPAQGSGRPAFKSSSRHCKDFKNDT